MRIVSSGTNNISACAPFSCSTCNNLIATARLCSDTADLVTETLEKQFELVKNRTSNNGMLHTVGCMCQHHRMRLRCLPRKGAARPSKPPFYPVLPGTYMQGSHVLQFGSLAIDTEPVGDYQGEAGTGGPVDLAQCAGMQPVRQHMHLACSHVVQTNRVCIVDTVHGFVSGTIRRADRCRRLVCYSSGLHLLLQT